MLLIFIFIFENETHFSFLCRCILCRLYAHRKIEMFFGLAAADEQEGEGSVCVCVCVWETCFFTQPHFSWEDSLFGFELTWCQEQNNCLLIEPSAAIQSAKVNTSADQIWISF